MKRKIKIIILLVFTLLSLLPPVIYVTGQLEKDNRYSLENYINPIYNFRKDSEIGQEIMDLDFQGFSNFPCNLSELYFLDNPVARAEKEEGIINYGAGFPLTPWNGFFISTHTEGPKKWYIDSPENAPIYAPADCIFWMPPENLAADINGIIVNTSNVQCAYDSGPTYLFSENLILHLGHVDVPITFLSELQEKGYKKFNAGDIIAYDSLAASPFDFGLADWEHYAEMEPYTYSGVNHLVCPLEYFQSDVKTQIESNYSWQYECMKLSGKVPDSTICSRISYSEENEIWGNWFFHHNSEKNYEDDIDGLSWTHDALDFLSFEGLHQTNPETFYRKMKYTVNESLDAGTIGLFRDNLPTEGNGLSFGARYVFSESGNNESGIIKLVFEPEVDEQNSFNETSELYAKFSIEKNDPGDLDDQLTIAFASSLSEAENLDLSENRASVYTRYQVQDYDTFYQDYPIEPKMVILTCIPFAIFVIIDAIVIFRKKEDKSNKTIERNNE